MTNSIKSPIKVALRFTGALALAASLGFSGVVPALAATAGGASDAIALPDTITINSGQIKSNVNFLGNDNATTSSPIYSIDVSSVVLVDPETGGITSSYTVPGEGTHALVFNADRTAVHYEFTKDPAFTQGQVTATYMWIEISTIGDRATERGTYSSTITVSVEPAPTEPAPTTPAPEPITPVIPEPAPEPAPTEPAPTEPAPTEPAPTEPAPTTPAEPVMPTPDPEPAPSTPTPALVGNSEAADDSATGASRTIIHIEDIHANDAATEGATWDASKDFLIDQGANAGAKAYMFINPVTGLGTATMTTADGVATLTQTDADSTSYDFVSNAGYVGEPLVDYFSTDTAGSTAQASLRITVTAPVAGVIPNASAADDVIEAFNGVGTVEDILANDTVSDGAAKSAGTTFLIDNNNGANKAFMVDGVATLTTAQGVLTVKANGDIVSGSFDGKGNKTVAPNVSYFNTDSKGASSQARIVVKMTELNEPPVDPTVPVTPEVPVETPEPEVNETPVDTTIPVPTPEVPGTPADTPVTNEVVQNTPANMTGFVPDASAETAAEGDSKNGILTTVFGFMGLGLLFAGFKKNAVKVAANQ